MRGARFAVCAGVALSCAIAQPSWAADTGDLQGLLSETFVSGASKATESGATAPAITTTLTSDDIRRYGLHTLAEAIDFLSLGAVTSNRLNRSDIGSDGVLITRDQGDHFLLLIDGHAMNEALFGAARFGRGAGIPIEMVDHIEVILGPGSVLYGSSAMLGVINVVTKEARDFGGTHVAAESEVLTSWRVAAGGGYEPSILGVPSKLVLELEYYQQDGPAFTLGPQQYGKNGFTNTPYNFGSQDPAGVWGGVADKSNYARVPSGLLTYRIGDFELLVRASTYKRASPFNADFVSPESDFNDPNNYEIDRSVSVDLKHRLSLSAVVEIKSRLYGDSFDYRRQADVSAFGPDECYFTVATCRRKFFGASRWLGLEEQASFDWYKDARFVTLLGVDGRVRSVLSQTDIVDASNDQPLASSTGVLRKTDGIFAAYAQQTWNPTTWLGLNGGARFDFDPRFSGHVSPRVAASAGTWRGGTLKVIYAEAFRAPSWEESSVVTTTQIPPGQLLPETVRSITVAFDQRLGAHRLTVALFRSWWTNMVELEMLTDAEHYLAQNAGLLSLGAANATQYRNVSSIDDAGFNAGYDGSFADGRLRYGLNVTGAMARRQENGMATPLPVAPQVFGNARLAYSLPGDLPTVAIAAHFLGTRPVDQVFGAGVNATPRAPPFAELRGTLSGVVPVIRGLSYRTSLNYAFTDQGPYVVGPFQSGIASAPTDFRVYPKAAELNPIDRFRVTVGLLYDF